MFASALQLQKDQKGGKRPAPPAEKEFSHATRAVAATQPALAAQWKRFKAEPVEHGNVAMTQQVQPDQRKPALAAWFGTRTAVAQDAEQEKPAMLGAWFGGGRASQAPTQLMRDREVYAGEGTQDSEDDKPLSKVVVQRDWKQQKQLQRMQATRKEKSPMAATFSTAREVNVQEVSKARAYSGRGAVCVSSNEDERVFQLSTKRRVTVRRWKSVVLTDIREYYDDSGVSKPGKKGISLAKDQWNTLLRLSRVIDEAVALVEDDNVDAHSLEHVKERIPVREDRTIAFTLSSKRRISVRFFRTSVLIDLREYYEQGTEMKPGKKGISLSKDQWRDLQKIQLDISEAIEEL